METKLEKKIWPVHRNMHGRRYSHRSGVFFKAQTVLQKTEGNMPLGILAWIIGGTIMIICILAFAAMAQRYEKGQRHRRLCRGHGRQEVRVLYRLVTDDDLLPHAHVCALVALRALYPRVHHLLLAGFPADNPGL